MKRFSNLYIIASIALAMISCNDFLDEEPISTIPPENYFNEESHFSAYAINLYDIFQMPLYQSKTVVLYDGDTDNQVIRNPNLSKFAPGQLRVLSDGGDWNFEEIYNCNYFFAYGMPKYKAGTVAGNKSSIEFHIGEVYFMRAYAYFKKLQLLGDMPIIKNTLPDNKEILMEAGKRMPRNEVARFILADLDSAKYYMKGKSVEKSKVRLSEDCATLLASRVALYEATWLKYFKGTAYVPNGPDWPGKSKDYNAGYEFPSGSIDAEIDYFLGVAMENSRQIADNYGLVTNTGVLQQTSSEAENPYFELFSDYDLSEYSEIMLWKKYDLGYGIVHGNAGNMQGGQPGITRGYVDNFLMANGLPIYASGSGYKGDDYIADVRVDRDSRLSLFLKEPEQINTIYPYVGGETEIPPIEPIPNLIGGADNVYQTGYAPRKGLSFDASLVAAGGRNITGQIVFRATEAYLNYIEACYEKNGSLDGNATKYWKAIRDRAHVNNDYTKTIGATDMNKEALNDWAAYSGGTLINTTLYNIRRERRSELFCEGFRDMDLRRWRAMDQMIDTPYHPEGIKLWGPMKDWYDPESLIYGEGSSSNVSDPALSIYYRPYEKNPNHIYYNGLRWAMGHYLSPIAVKHFVIASPTNDVVGSVVYQNPDWPTTAGQGAIK